MSNKRLRIILLVYADLVPPPDVKELDPSTFVPWEVEFNVKSALVEDLKHEVMVLGVSDTLRSIKEAVQEFRPHIIFNLLEEFAGEAVFDQHIVSYLELLGVPYTGCNPRGLMIARDKALSKKILAYHRIKTPKFFVFPRNKRKRLPKGFTFPLIVKSLTEEASTAIAQKSVVGSESEMIERIAFLHESLQTHVIVEEFIAGREIYVGVLGNERLQTLPPWELLMTKKKDSEYLLASHAAKWDPKYQKRKGLETLLAEGFNEAELKHIAKNCKRIYRQLCMSGYGRLDFRVDKNNVFYLLEANPNPNISYGEDFAESAESMGISYPALLQQIIRNGLGYNPVRYG